MRSRSVGNSLWEFVQIGNPASDMVCNTAKIYGFEIKV